MTPAKQWIDPQGRIVPEHLVSDIDRMKDELAFRLVSSAENVQQVEAAFKETAFDEMYAAKALIFEKYGARLGGRRDGFGIKSYDGSCEVRISVADRIAFSVELQAAKALIDECITRWAGDGINENLRLLVDDAFRVNKAGRIDTKRVLGLRKFKMTNPDGSPDLEWERAMEAITDAMITDQSATYIRFYRRDEATGVMKLVNLDFSKL